jgi:creatinine amidohydrolase
LLSPEPVGHAGEVEASYALALAPELVNRARLTPGHPVGSLPDLAPAVVPWAFHEMTRTGNIGDPTLATAEQGRALLAPLLDRLCEIVTAIGEEAPTFQRRFVPPL